MSASDLPDNMSKCQVSIDYPVGAASAVVTENAAPTKTLAGFDFIITKWNRIESPSDLKLFCAGVRSNTLEKAIKFNLIPIPR